MVPTASSENHPSPAAEPRRGFLIRATAWATAGLAFLAPVGAGIAALLNPLFPKRSGDSAAEEAPGIRLTTLDALPADGTPRKFPVITERVDAWMRSVEPVGAVYLRKTGPAEVQALQVVCPHAGCSVEYRALGEASTKSAKEGYVCPCHKAIFDVEGKRLQADSQSPRDMDALAVEVRDGEVWVQFQNFETGTPDQVPLT